MGEQEARQVPLVQAQLLIELLKVTPDCLITNPMGLSQISFLMAQQHLTPLTSTP